MVEVRLTPEAAEELDELPVVIRKRMDKLIGRLKDYPDVSGAKWLSGKLAGKCRLRTGHYRLQFHVKESTVKDEETGEEIELTRIIVEKVGHRDGFYGG